MGTRTLLSLQAFMQLPDDGTRHELDEGELVVMPPVKFRHTQIAKRIYDALFVYLFLRQKGRTPHGELFCEAPYLLKEIEGKEVVRVPDVSYINDDRARKTGPDRYMEGAPALAVEVVSPTDTAEGMTRKVSQYLAAGAVIVWVIYPESREVHVFASRALTSNNQGPLERQARILGDRETLTA